MAPELYAQEDFREACSERFSVMVTRGRFAEDEAEGTLSAHFGTVPPGADDALLRAAGAVLSYALTTQRGQLAQVTRFLRYDPSAYMQVGETALATLEVFTTNAPADSRSVEARTLLNILDTTRTAPGRRLLRAWLRHPLLEEPLISRRQDAVEAFVRDTVLRREVRKALYKLHDLERLASKLVTGRANARDLCALARSLALVPELKSLLAGRSEGALQALAERLHGLGTTHERISAALVENPPLKLTEGGLIQGGFDSELDTLRAAAEGGRAWIAALETSERASTGIPTLKIGFNGVFGYYLEVTRPYYDEVPESYRAVQTLKDRQRYVRPDLREREREILRAETAARGREYAVFGELRAGLAPAADAVRDLGAALAELDTYSALAEVAAEGRYCRPSFSDGVLSIEGGRHPVVERFQPVYPERSTPLRERTPHHPDRAEHVG